MFYEVYDHDIARQAGSPDIGKLLSIWKSARKGWSPPSEISFMASVPEAYEKHLMILAPLGKDDFIYEYYGPEIVLSAGFDMTNRKVSDFGGEVGQFFMACYRRIMAEQKPLFTLHRASFAHNVHLWERLLLPVVDLAGALKIVVMNRVRAFETDLLAAIFESSATGIMALRFVYSPDGAIENATILRANNRALEICDLGVVDVEGKDVLASFPELYDTGVWQRILWVGASRKPARLEHEYRIGDRATRLEIIITPLGDGVLMTYVDQPVSTETVVNLTADLARLEDENFKLKQRLAELEHGGADMAGARGNPRA